MTSETDATTKASIEKWEMLRRAQSPIGVAKRIRELEAGIIEARRCLAKGRALWNGPCHECDGVLAALLTTEPAKAEEER
jgi:hypothetical protein